MAKRLPDAATVARRWQEAMQRPSTSQKYKENIQALDFNPLERAAAAGDAYIAGCQAGNAKRAKNLLSYGQQNWVAACVNKGASRLGPGATASQARYTGAMGKVLPMIASVLAQLPTGSSKAVKRERMIAFSDGMASQAAQG